MRKIAFVSSSLALLVGRKDIGLYKRSKSLETFVDTDNTAEPPQLSGH